MEENENINVNEEVEQQEQEKQQESFTREDVDRLISLAYEKAEKKLSKKYEKEINRQKSLVGLDEESRAKAEKEQRINELEEELNKYKLSNTKAEIAKVLGNRGLDPNLVDFIVTSDDTDECMEKIESLDKIFKNMVKKEVDARLKANSYTPRSSLGLDGSITREQFTKMSLSEQSTLAINNKQLYDELTKK